MGESEDSNEDLDWYIVKGLREKPIGALGFMGNEVAVIASFYDDYDGNQDGTVSVPERVIGFLSPLRLKGKAVAEVAMAARFDLEVNERDPEFYSIAVDIWLKFMKGLVIDGCYTAWMGVAISFATGLVSKQIATGLVKQFIIKKGMEMAVKKSIRKAMGRP